MLALASDHGGFALKKAIKTHLEKRGIAYHDYGCYSEDSCDYPDFAHALAKGIEHGEVDRGIAVCGSGQGISITLNKHQSIRAALVWQEEIAKLARQHNNANVLCLPGRFISTDEAERCLTAFLNTPFEGGRHERRVEKIPVR